jgi:hypothetical protein
MFLPECKAKFHTHGKQERKIIVVCIVIFIFLDSKLEDIRFCIVWRKAFP